MLKTKIMLFCGASLGFYAFPVFAQQSDADNGIVYSGEIVVTATKRSSTLKDVPQSIAALSEDMLESRGVDLVTFRDWQRIEAAEAARARDGAPREKFIAIAEMLGARGR